MTFEIDLQETPVQLLQKIETELRLSGEPLRWAITSVDIPRRKAIVEAVVTSDQRALFD
jgi:peptide subunit release factor RF-3